MEDITKYINQLIEDIRQYHSKTENFNSLTYKHNNCKEILQTIKYETGLSQIIALSKDQLPPPSQLSKPQTEELTNSLLKLIFRV